jgi:hypothetical protein
MKQIYLNIDWITVVGIFFLLWTSIYFKDVTLIGLLVEAKTQLSFRYASISTESPTITVGF